MHYQGSNNTSSSSSGPSSAGLTNLPTHLYRGDPRAQYSAASYNQSYQTPVRDASSSGTQSYSGMNMQQQRNKFASKGAPPIAVSSGMPAYNSPLVLVPSSNMFNGMPQMSPFMASPMTGQADQMGQYSYVTANMHPNMGSMIPCSSIPYAMNYEMHGNKPAVWYTPDQKGVQNDTYGSMQYYPAPFVPAMDGSSLQAYSYAPMYPQMASLPVQGYQVMKTTDGYVFQDLEALTQQDPAIPHAVPAMWTNPSELTLAKCLENREGITNVYIRGFLPETTDDMLHAYAVRFGKIERRKAIVDLETGLCKGYSGPSTLDKRANDTDTRIGSFAFVQFYSFESCENCIRGFYYLGYQASFAQKSRNSRLKDLEDRSSTNIYCTNLPIDWTEAVSLLSPLARERMTTDHISGPSSPLRALPCSLGEDQPR